MKLCRGLRRRIALGSTGARQGGRTAAHASRLPHHTEVESGEDYLSSQGRIVPVQERSGLQGEKLLVFSPMELSASDR